MMVIGLRIHWLIVTICALILTLGNTLLIYTTLFFIQVAYMKSHKTTKRQQYKPKSPRAKGWRYTTRLKTWAIQWGSKVTDPISKWANSRKERKTIYERTKIARRMQKGNGKKRLAFLAFAAVAMQGTGGLKDNHTSFGTDLAPIGIDNRCTGCISHRIEDFEGPLQESNRAIKGFGGTRTTNVKIGTIVWRWNDDQGKHHKFVIPKSFYVLQGNIQLLSPQHWAQTQKDRNPTAGTGSETLDDKITLFWKQRKCKLTVPLGRNDNVATFTLADGF
jgi:hypothetical protein